MTRLWLSYGRFKDGDSSCGWGSGDGERYQVPNAGDWIVTWAKDTDPVLIYPVISTEEADWDEDGFRYFAETECDSEATIETTLSGLDFDEHALMLLPAFNGWRGVPRLVDGLLREELLDLLATTLPA